MLKEKDGKLYYVVVDENALLEAVQQENYEIALRELKKDYVESKYAEIQIVDANSSPKIKAVNFKIPSKDGVDVVFTIVFEDKLSLLKYIIADRSLKELEDYISEIEIKELITNSKGYIPGIDEDTVSLDMLASFFNDNDLLAPDSKEYQAVEYIHKASKIMLLQWSDLGLTVEEIQRLNIIPIPTGFTFGKHNLGYPEQGEFAMIDPVTGMTHLLFYNDCSRTAVGEDADGLHLGFESISDEPAIPYFFMIRSLKAIDACVKEFKKLAEEEQDKTDIRIFMCPISE